MERMENYKLSAVANRILTGYANTRETLTGRRSANQFAPKERHEHNEFRLQKGSKLPRQMEYQKVGGSN
jgi:hypothetical protein